MYRALQQDWHISPSVQILQITITKWFENWFFFMFSPAFIHSLYSLYTQYPFSVYKNSYKGLIQSVLLRMNIIPKIKMGCSSRGSCFRVFIFLAFSARLVTSVPFLLFPKYCKWITFFCTGFQVYLVTWETIKHCRAAYWARHFRTSCLEFTN